MKLYDVEMTVHLRYFSVRSEDGPNAENIATEEMYDILKSSHLGVFSIHASAGDGVEDDDEQLEEEDQWNGPKQ